MSGGAHIEVLSAPAHTVVQDGGRSGYAHLGVSRCGAADWLSVCALNRMLGNGDGCAVVEMGVAGAGFVVRSGRVCVVVGGRVRGAAVRTDGVDRPALLWRPMMLGDGDVLTIEKLSAGEKGYIAVRGGFDGPMVLGSRSTHATTGLGMNPLAEGDRLGVCGTGDGAEVGDDGVRVDRRALVGLVRVLSGDVVRAVRNAEVSGLGDDELSFVVDGRGDRVGGLLRPMEEQIRTSADPLLVPPAGVTCAGGARLSEGVGHGVLQWPGDGTVVALGPDAAPTGGYPVIGTVIHADLPMLAQRGVGSRVRVRWVTVADARAAMGDRLAMLGRVFGGVSGDGFGDVRCGLDVEVQG